MKKLSGILMIVSPFIALLCLPLYTPVPWLIVLAAFGTTAIVVAVIGTGTYLVGKSIEEEE